MIDKKELAYIDLCKILARNEDRKLYDVLSFFVDGNHITQLDAWELYNRYTEEHE